MTAQQTAAPVVPGVTWSRVFPATPDQAGQARHFLAGILGDCPGADDAILCLSELAANALQHSRSARPGGQFTVRVHRAPGWLRVEVTDEGGPWAPAAGGDGHGRGLTVVRALAASLAIGATCPGSPARTVSFEMSLG